MIQQPQLLLYQVIKKQLNRKNYSDKKNRKVMFKRAWEDYLKTKKKNLLLQI